MTPTSRPEPFFVGEDRALDFLNSVASPWGTEIDWVADGGDLLDWLELAELVPGSVVARFRREATREELDRVAAQARALREWFRDFVMDHAGPTATAAKPVDIRPINDLLATDRSYRQIEAQTPLRGGDPNNPTLRLARHRHWDFAEDLLLPLAEAMADLICRHDFERVKQCEGETCTLWFHDVSKNHTRRWCSMAICGNRAKAAAHRARKRDYQ